MENNKIISDRQFAASLARKYFGGEISRFDFFDQYPDYSNDIKLITLYNKVDEEQKPRCLFGPSKEEHIQYVNEALILIDEIESNKLNANTLFSLLKELWFSSDNCNTPIQNIGIHLTEVGKSTNDTIDDVRRYLELLMTQNYIELISKEPLIFEFTEKGKTIKTLKDAKEILKKVMC